ncbi:MAG: TIGR01440 family protein [Clostridia bacterium]|nr:TIGR01440 family protein [Clostridia bacterium]
MINMKEIKKQTEIIIKEYLEKANLKKGDILVIGCSSSEIKGDIIGKGSDFNAAKEVFDVIHPIIKEKGIFLAAQCCEHLNRALIIEYEAAEKYNLEIVNVIPQIKAGGSFATSAFEGFENPVAVEELKAHGGIDIGDTLIGMHLKKVAVPLRLSIKNIGEANVVCARTRPKFIGGIRAKYNEE